MGVGCPGFGWQLAVTFFGGFFYGILFVHVLAQKATNLTLWPRNWRLLLASKARTSFSLPVLVNKPVIIGCAPRFQVHSGNGKLFPGGNGPEKEITSTYLNFEPFSLLWDGVLDISIMWGYGWSILRIAWFGHDKHLLLSGQRRVVPPDIRFIARRPGRPSNFLFLRRCILRGRRATFSTSDLICVAGMVLSVRGRPGTFGTSGWNLRGRRGDFSTSIDVRGSLATNWDWWGAAASYVAVREAFSTSGSICVAGVDTSGFAWHAGTVGTSGWRFAWQASIGASAWICLAGVVLSVPP